MGTQCRQPPVLAEPAGGLLQTPLGGSWSPWSLSAALGTRAGCVCERAGGMEDAAAVERGVLGGEGELSSVHCVGVRWVDQVVHRWAVWLLFKGCTILKGTAGHGQLDHGVKSAPHNWRDSLSAPRGLGGPGRWSSH